MKQPLAEDLAYSWVRTGDYLFDTTNIEADFVIGNPPYVRLEDIPEETVLFYREAYPTMRGRADLYVAFFEAALRQLRKDGVCAFICADRWMRNQYGAELREMVTAGFSVDVVIEMHNADAFLEEVDAYRPSRSFAVRNKVRQSWQVPGRKSRRLPLKPFCLHSLRQLAAKIRLRRTAYGWRSGTLDASGFGGFNYPLVLNNVTLSQPSGNTGHADLEFYPTISYSLGPSGLPLAPVQYPNFLVSGTVQSARYRLCLHLGHP